MSEIPKTPVKKSRLRDLALDEMAVAPGETFDLPDPIDSPAPVTGKEVDPGIEQIFSADGRQKVVVQNARPERRISPLVSGKKPMPRVAQIATRAHDAPRTAGLVSGKPEVRYDQKIAPGELIVQLGRFGDIINILPAAYDQWRNKGRKVPIMVAKEFASVLEGVKYVTPIVFDGGHDQLTDAVAKAKQLDPHCRVAQVWDGKNVALKERDNYQREAWKKIGYSPKWDQLSLVFDNRDERRETELASRFDWSKPVILLSLKANSIPFPHADRVRAGIEAVFGETHKVIELTNALSTRIYDLLGLFDRAHVLVTCDTATLHLSEASSVPIVAFRSSNFWLGSAKRAKHILNRRYNDIDMDEVVDAIKKLTPKEPANIVHVYPAGGFSELDTPRQTVAANSWRTVFENAERIGFSGESAARTSSKLGEDRETFFVRDMLEAALAKTKNLGDIVILSNSDVGLTPTAAIRIRQFCAAKGALFAHRFNHDKINENGVGEFQNCCGHLDGGLDLFCFTRRWLLIHGGKLPDMLVGRTGWDLVYRDVIKKTGGGELYGCVWHEAHKSWWNQNMESSGNVHNTELFKKYRNENDITRPYDR